MLPIVAIIAVRNGALTLPRVLSHYREHGIDVIAIDHGSVDGTDRILADHARAPVIDTIRLPFDGVFRLHEHLTLKADLATRVPHAWIIHTDADEILESPNEGESLAEMIARLHQAGYDLINSDEFVFVPATEHENYSHGDFVAAMRRYYYFHPPRRSLQRVVRCGTGHIGWAANGGHLAGGAGRRLSPERVRLRHYIGLSFDDLRAQYLGRVFSGAELRAGGHWMRVPTTPGFVTPPPADRLLDLDIDGWRVDHPESTHLIFHQETPYRPPAAVPAGDGSRTPVPVVVGVDSGSTTLLRLMLEAHPEHAAMHKTHEAIAAVAHHDPSDGLSMIALARAFPEAHFVHVIRDGREAALGPPKSGIGGPAASRDRAIAWLWRTREIRQEAQFVPHYLEVRYEDLVRSPEAGLRHVNAFLARRFDAAQIDRTQIEAWRRHPRDARGRRDGTRGMTMLETAAFERVAGVMLQDLGYEVTSVCLG